MEYTDRDNAIFEIVSQDGKSIFVCTTILMDNSETLRLAKKEHPDTFKYKLSIPFTSKQFYSFLNYIYHHDVLYHHGKQFNNYEFMQHMNNVASVADYLEWCDSYPLDLQEQIITDIIYDVWIEEEVSYTEGREEVYNLYSSIFVDTDHPISWKSLVEFTKKLMDIMDIGYVNLVNQNKEIILKLIDNIRTDIMSCKEYKHDEFIYSLETAESLIKNKVYYLENYAIHIQNYNEIIRRLTEAKNTKEYEKLYLIQTIQNDTANIAHIA